MYGGRRRERIHTYMRRSETSSALCVRARSRMCVLVCVCVHVSAQVSSSVVDLFHMFHETVPQVWVYRTCSLIMRCVLLLYNAFSLLKCVLLAQIVFLTLECVLLYASRAQLFGLGLPLSRNDVLKCISQVFSYYRSKKILLCVPCGPQWCECECWHARAGVCGRVHVCP